ncbi:MAG: hypothetical protein UY65_C0004G0025 [Parcubacteria group bacterium GW2011_GWA2_51_12]|nr:MAG: hypothetical protein UY65_C0004G0025 [Parcubacteria group bacterium GW2011_GWA2_51_12]
MSDILIPRRAQETALVPSKWRVVSDCPERALRLNELDGYHFSTHSVGFSRIERHSGAQVADVLYDDVIVGRDYTPVFLDNEIGSLGFAELVLNFQSEGRDIMPASLELRAEDTAVLLNRTVLCGTYLCIGFLYWRKRLAGLYKRWELGFIGLRGPSP